MGEAARSLQIQLPQKGRRIKGRDPEAFRASRGHTPNPGKNEISLHFHAGESPQPLLKGLLRVVPSVSLLDQWETPGCQNAPINPTTTPNSLPIVSTLILQNTWFLVQHFEHLGGVPASQCAPLSRAQEPSVRHNLAWRILGRSSSLTPESKFTLGESAHPSPPWICPPITTLDLPTHHHPGSAHPSPPWICPLITTLDLPTHHHPGSAHSSPPWIHPPITTPDPPTHHAWPEIVIGISRRRKRASVLIRGCCAAGRNRWEKGLSQRGRSTRMRGVSPLEPGARPP